MSDNSHIIIMKLSCHYYVNISHKARQSVTMLSPKLEGYALHSFATVGDIAAQLLVTS